MRRRRLVQPALAPRQQQRRRAEPSRLDRPLPDAVATRAVAASRARRSGSRPAPAPAAPPSSTSRSPPEGENASSARDVARRELTAAREVQPRERPQLAGGRDAARPRPRRPPGAASRPARRRRRAGPAVPPSDTRRRSTGGIEPGILPPHGSRRPRGNARHLPPAALRAHPVVGARAARGLREHHAHARRAVDRVPAGGRPARHDGGGGLARAGDPGADPVRGHRRAVRAGDAAGRRGHPDLRHLDLRHGLRARAPAQPRARARGAGREQAEPPQDRLRLAVRAA